MSGYNGTARVANVESWNGTNWTEVNDINTARSGLEAVGADNTSSLAFGGLEPPTTGKTESYNGTNWTEGNDLNTARYNLKGSGSATLALGFGGGPPAVANTESWNGTNWTETSDLSTARYFHSGAGSSTAALAAGGNTGPADSAATEEFTGAGPVTRTFTDS